MPSKTKPLPPIDDQLREAILQDDRTAYRLAIDTGVDERAIRRFLARDQDLTLGSASRIAAALGLQLRRR